MSCLWGELHARVTVRYVAANPGSYTYLNGFRPDLADPTYQTWQVPVTSCPYNRYKYGLEAVNDYLDDTPPATMVAQYPTRRVTYLLGELDTSRAGTFDSSCQADLQGLHRLERGSAFAAFMDRYHPQHRHQRVVVPRVAHAAGLMFNSPQGRAAIFPPAVAAS